MDSKLIKNLVRLMQRAELNELEIEDEKNGLRLYMKRAADAAAPVMVPGSVYPGAMFPGSLLPAGLPSPVPSGASAGGVAQAAKGEAGRGAASGGIEIKSPMVGTFYRAPSPDSEPFVQPGASIDEESVVCIIEAMKVMNEIRAEIRGEILEILVESGEPVEYGQPLFLVKTR